MGWGNAGVSLCGWVERLGGRLSPRSRPPPNESPLYLELTQVLAEDEGGVPLASVSQRPASVSAAGAQAPTTTFMAVRVGGRESGVRVGMWGQWVHHHVHGSAL